MIYNRMSRSNGLGGVGLLVGLLDADSSTYSSIHNHSVAGNGGIFRGTFAGVASVPFFLLFDLHRN